MRQIPWRRVLAEVGVIVGALAALCFPGLSSAQVPHARLQETVFGHMPDGRAVKQFTLRNANGTTANSVTGSRDAGIDTNFKGSLFTIALTSYFHGVD